MLVGLYTGTRSSAICGAALMPTVGRSHVDLDRRMFYRRAIGRRQTKKRQTPVKLPARLLAHMRQWQRQGMLKKSERRLCEEVDLHLAYRWFCRLDLDDQVPDHSTFSVNRHGRFRDSDILRQVFEAVVRACMDAGLVRGEGFAVDASVIEANASRYHGKAPGEIDWSVPERQTRAAAEFLAGFDDEDPDADLKPPKAISPSDPCSAWTAKANKRVQFGYGLNYLIDIAHAIIVDVEPTPARSSDEVKSTKTMLVRTERCFGLKPKRLAADTAYGTGKFLGWLIGTRIAPHIPVWDKKQPRRRHIIAQRLPLGSAARRLHLPER